VAPHARSAVALIGSPYQALAFLEYVAFAGIEHGVVFVNRVPDPDMLTPTLNTLARLKGFTFRFRRRGGFGHPAATTGEAAMEMAEVARVLAPDAVLVIGDYRETVGWRLARELDCAGGDVVVLDDGNMTMLIDRSDGGVEPVIWSEEAERGGFLPLPEVSFFTAYADILKAGRADIVHQNSWQALRSAYVGLARSESLSLVVGQAFARVGITDDAEELRIAQELVATARKLLPHTTPLYMAHRAEPDHKLRSLAADCHVARFDLPAELVPVAGGALPAAVVGHYSTVLTSYADLVPGAFPIYAVRMPYDRLLDVKKIALAYDDYAARYRDLISVIDALG
jgi:hypothetical protein